MGIFTYIIVGLVAGLLAKLIVPGKGPGGLIITIVLGILGALLGSWIGQKAGWGTITGFNWTTIGLATLGSIILLVIYGLLAKKK